jgi:hypothetical protein
VLRLHGWKVSRDDVCGSKLASLYIERINKRMGSWLPMRVNKALFIAGEVLEGVQSLVRTYQEYLKVTEEMVGLNEDQQVRVWRHPNFAEDRPYSVLVPPFLDSS